MTVSNKWIRRAYVMIAGILAVSIGGFLESCDERLVSLSRIVEPCGTFLANCNPGDIETNAASVGDYCVDPACTVPGQCGTGQQALGTITELCP